jgi:hypothetical protein
MVKSALAGRGLVANPLLTAFILPPNCRSVDTAGSERENINRRREPHE